MIKLFSIVQVSTGMFFADDIGGSLFITERMAQKAVEKWKLSGVVVRERKLDDDLVHMEGLFNFAKAS